MVAPPDQRGCPHGHDVSRYMAANPDYHLLICTCDCSYCRKKRGDADKANIGKVGYTW